MRSAKLKLRRLASLRYYASQVPSKGPLIYGFKPPAAPEPAQTGSSAASASSSAKSTTGSSPNRPTPSMPVSSLPKPRLDYNALLSDPDHTTLNAIRRASPLTRDHLSHLTRLRETQLILLQKLSTIRGKQKEIGSLIKTGLGDPEENKRQAKKLKTRVKEYEANLNETEAELLDLALALPNFSHPSSPVGEEANAITLETFGPDTKLKQVDNRRDHVDFASHYDLLDNDASATTTGGSWPFLKSTLALLEQALINYALSVAIRHGFTPVIPPDVVKSDIAWRCGFQPRDSHTNPSTQTYHLSPSGSGSGSSSDPSVQSHLCLAGTSEIPLAGLFANRLFHEEDLPRKVVGVGRAFRAEAGARGSDTRGLYRVHQFTKVELFAVTAQNGSEGLMEEIRAVQKEIAQGLGLSVRVLDMPTEELGASAHRKYDMEAWMPGRGKWGEITSTSNCTDYQSRRLSITYRPSPSNTAFDPTQSPPPTPAELAQPPSNKDKTGPFPFAHTLNGTAAAIPRLLVALIENGIRFNDVNNKDGSKAGAGAGAGAGYDGLDLPVALQRFWVGRDVVGDGKNKGSIRWV
ncbi:serine-tRNA ligase [Kwoniella heveanensis BCC8398]|uniref:serine--tRNA ligase n=1 Tax=Kwoniella heveanensis BCC8398 TaxID=1296120 RepID=A0A1B9GKB9_9TREE|nr:serine-tRNA ligase [Kwoniella heveanensis BCC8398]